MDFVGGAQGGWKKHARTFKPKFATMDEHTHSAFENKRRKIIYSELREEEDEFIGYISKDDGLDLAGEKENSNGEGHG